MKQGLNYFFALLSLLFIFPFVTRAQGEDEKQFHVNGYVKDMLSIFDLDTVTYMDNLIHNRFNVEWNWTDDITLYVGMRNRVFFGDLVSQTPNYSTFIDTNNDYFDLSFNSIDKQKLVVNSVFDRLYLEWIVDEWEFRIGRQRVNWGTNIVWNPNDLFNAYSFFDFDYEERPGSDAIRIIKYFGFASSLEVAAKYADNIDEVVAAAMYKFNTGGYDVQLISGIAQGDFTAGIGWAGNIKNAGFKGEASYFTPYEDRPFSRTVFTGSVTIDYSFSNSIYLLGSYLYNSNPGGQLNLLGGGSALSAKSLMPYEHSLLAQFSYPFHPLMNTGLAIMSFPGEKSFFLNPSFGISASDNLDIGLFGQLLFDNPNDKVESTFRGIFTRVKWSF